MVAEVFAGLGALKTAFDIARGLQDTHDANVRGMAVIDLQRHILAAQQEQMALTEQVGELKAKIAEFEDWDREKKRYSLTDFGGGTFAYALKPDETSVEPMHRLCPNCYQQRKKALLQFKFKLTDGRERWQCSGCDKEFDFGSSLPPRPLNYSRSGFV